MSATGAASPRWRGASGRPRVRHPSRGQRARALAATSGSLATDLTGSDELDEVVDAVSHPGVHGVMARDDLRVRIALFLEVVDDPSDEPCQEYRDPEQADDRERQPVADGLRVDRTHITR